MRSIKLYCSCIIFNCSIKVSLFPECKSSIMIEICLIRFKFYCFREGLYRLIEISFAIKRDTFIIISECICWIDWDSWWIIANSLVKVTNFIICKASIEKSFEMIWHNLNGFTVKVNSSWIVTLLSGCITLWMVDFSLLLSLLSISSRYLLRKYLRLLLLLRCPWDANSFRSRNSARSLLEIDWTINRPNSLYSIIIWGWRHPCLWKSLILLLRRSSWINWWIETIIMSCLPHHRHYIPTVWFLILG